MAALSAKIKGLRFMVHHFSRIIERLFLGTLIVESLRILHDRQRTVCIATRGVAFD